MSSRGQVVIPLAIRKQLQLKEGAEFIVLSHGDAVMFKVVQQPSSEEFQTLLKKLRHHARKAGLKHSDIPKTIRKVRAQK